MARHDFDSAFTDHQGGDIQLSLKLRLLNRISDWLVRRGSAALITRDGQPYLLRHFILNTKWLNVYFHRFYAPDDGATGVHDHPWNNASFILHGGFIELFHDGTKKLRIPGNFAFRQALVMHRIDTLLAPPGEVYTLFFMGRRKRTWGFFKTQDWDEVVIRTISGKNGWFLPSGPTPDRDESSLVGGIQ